MSCAKQDPWRYELFLMNPVPASPPVMQSMSWATPECVQSTDSFKNPRLELQPSRCAPQALPATPPEGKPSCAELCTRRCPPAKRKSPHQTAETAHLLITCCASKSAELANIYDLAAQCPNAKWRYLHDRQMDKALPLETQG